MITTVDKQHLQRCIALAEEALAAGDEPFGSVLVAADGVVLREARNEVVTRDATCHPEYELAHWAARHLSPEQRAAATVYTSGEHCPMCSAAHGWVRLGRIVYASSSAQLASWLAEMGLDKPPVRMLPIGEIVPDQIVDGPDPELAEQVRQLHLRLHQQARS